MRRAVFVLLAVVLLAVLTLTTWGRDDEQAAECPPQPPWAQNGCKTVLHFAWRCPVFYGCL